MNLTKYNTIVTVSSLTFLERYGVTTTDDIKNMKWEQVIIIAKAAMFAAQKVQIEQTINTLTQLLWKEQAPEWKVKLISDTLGPHLETAMYAELISYTKNLLDNIDEVCGDNHKLNGMVIDRYRHGVKQKDLAKEYNLRNDQVSKLLRNFREALLDSFRVKERQMVGKKSKIRVLFTQEVYDYILKHTVLLPRPVVKLNQTAFPCYVKIAGEDLDQLAINSVIAHGFAASVLDWVAVDMAYDAHQVSDATAPTTAYPNRLFYFNTFHASDILGVTPISRRSY